MGLTFRALVIAAAITLAGIAGEWSAAPEAGLVWRFGAAVLLIAVIYEAWKIRSLNLKISTDIRPAVFLDHGESFQLIFLKSTEEHVELQYRFSPQANFLLPDVVHSVKMREKRNHTKQHRLKPLSLGNHHLPAVNIRILGPLGLAWWRKKLDLGIALRVGPAYLRRSTSHLGRSATGESAGAPIGSGVELHSLRNYRPGDPRRSIDWKATARSRRLKTREWTEDQHLEIMIAIDASQTSRIRVEGPSRLGHFANVAAQLSEYAVQNDDKVGVLIFAGEPLSMVLPCRGLAGVMRIRDVLAEVETQPAESSPLSAMLQLRQQLRHRCLIIVMSDLDGQNATGQLSQSLQLLMPKHSTLVVGLENSAVSNLRSATAEEWIDPYVSVAAAEHISNRRASIQQLRRRGCQVVTAPSKELARQVLNTYQVLRQRHQI